MDVVFKCCQIQVWEGSQEFSNTSMGRKMIRSNNGETLLEYDLKSLERRPQRNGLGVELCIL